MKKDRDFREKSDAVRRGKGFVGQRGGNETLTPQQIALAEATDKSADTNYSRIRDRGGESSGLSCSKSSTLLCFVLEDQGDSSKSRRGAGSFR